MNSPFGCPMKNGFPSGFAGGQTIEPNLQDYSANFLVLEEQYECQGGKFIQIKVRLPNIDSSLYGILATPFQEGEIGEILTHYPDTILDLTDQLENDYLEWTAPISAEKWLLLVFNREWNRHQANLLSGAAMKQFITVTHQRYYDTFQKAGEEGVFGTTIQGIFTDEPGIMYYQGE